MRPLGICITMPAIIIGSIAPSKGVSIQPGHTAFTRMPYGATSWPTDLVSAMMPALAVA